ncbi:hypothetical protein MCOR02_004289 [Pyricularia oryzae]|nr:hypothetical protein MCOR02_004289 [Pyricularia oryzae]
MGNTASPQILTSPPRCHKQRQMRRSCNACSAHKIRCGKQHPTCARCSAKALRCEYSMSMRTGERPRFTVRNDGDQDQQEPADLTPASSHTRSPESEASQAMAASSPAAQQTQTTPDKSSCQIIAGADELSYVLQPNGQLGDTAIFPEFALPGNTIDYHTQHLLFPPKDYPIQQDYTNLSSLVRYQTKGGAFQNPLQRAQITTGRLDSPAAESTGSFCAGDRDDSSLWTMGSTKVHDCTVELLALVASSHVLTSNCMTAANELRSGTSAKGFCTDHNSPKEMGAVIQKNEQLLRKLGDMMDCNCSTRQDVLVLMYLAISKALEWYKAVLRSDGDNEPTRSRTMAWITRTNVSIGSYSLDSDAEKLVSAHLVLTQIKNNVNPLLKRLNSKLYLHATSVATPDHENGNWWSSDNFTTDNADATGNLCIASGVGRKVLEYHHNALVEELALIFEKIQAIKRTG